MPVYIQSFWSSCGVSARSSTVVCRSIVKMRNLLTAMGSRSRYAVLFLEFKDIVLIAPQNLFGNTECGAMLLSIGGSGRDAALLRAVPNTSYAFIPIDATSGHQSSNQLLELVILADSGDCPDISLRGTDGHFHTGDLFQEMATGSYTFCGRNDDWIKSENSLRCDTKYVHVTPRFLRLLIYEPLQGH